MSFFAILGVWDGILAADFFNFFLADFCFLPGIGGVWPVFRDKLIGFELKDISALCRMGEISGYDI